MPDTPARRTVRRWAPLLLALAFGAWEICFAAFMADDLFQLARLEGLMPETSRPVFDLYTLSDGDPAHVLAMKDAGYIPWFFDPVFEMRFFRPLSSALLALDHAVFGLHPSGYRLHGVLWAALLAAMAAIIFSRTMPARTAVLASVVFVVSGIHGIFCWTAARHALIAAALGFVAVVSHLRWRQDGWKPGAWLSLVALTLSLMASEAGVAVAAYVVLYELLCSSEPLRARLRVVAPTLVLVGLYLIAWQVRGHGASTGSGYVNPLRDPETFVSELPMRLAVLLGSLVLGGNADLWVLRPDLRLLQVGIGAAAMLIFALILRSVWRDATDSERQTLRWFGAATVISALPFAGTPIGSRCLLVPLVGTSGLLATVIERWWTSRIPSRLLAIAAAALAAIHLLFAPLGRLASPILLKTMMSDRAAAVMRDAEIDPATISSQHALVLAAPDLIVGLHGGLYPILYRQPRPAVWRVLSWSPFAHRIVRTSSNTLEMAIEGGGISSGNLTAGTVVALHDMKATVLAVGPLGPTRVRFDFEQSLDDPSLTLLAWRDERLRRVPPPAVGEAITLTP